MAKKKTPKQHKDRIDRVFHEYIRRRDVDNDSGYGSCISCGKGIHYSESDAGHFITRKSLKTRWDERNVNLQCRKCNRFEYGRQFEYSINIGRELAEELLLLSKQTLKLMNHEYIELYEKFRDKLKALKNIQDF